MDADFQSAQKSIGEALARLKPSVLEIDHTLGKVVEATGAGIMNAFAKLRERVVRAERRNQEVLRGHLDKAAIAIFPIGRPQERVVSPLYFANKYGRDIFVRIAERIEIESSEHQVLDL